MPTKPLLANDHPRMHDKLRDTRKQLHRLPPVVGQNALSRLPCDRTLSIRWAQNGHSPANAVLRLANSERREPPIPLAYPSYDGRQSKPLVAVWRLNKPEHLQTNSTPQTGSSHTARAAELPVPISSAEHLDPLERSRGTPVSRAARTPRHAGC